MAGPAPAPVTDTSTQLRRPADPLGCGCENHQVVSGSIQNFFVASASAAGALIGLLWGTLRGGLLLIVLAVTFVIQLLEGTAVTIRPGNSGAVNAIAILVVVCFLIGIGRAWDMIGGPSIGLTREVTTLVRGHDHGADAPAADDSRGAEDPKEAPQP
jgi:hypothetical protein